MRRKNILWISLIATLLVPMLIVNISNAQEDAVLYIDPPVIPTDGTMGHPGDTFDMNIKIENVIDLWSIAFIVDYVPFGRPLIVGAPAEGDFMIGGEDNYQTSFTYKIDVLKGQLKIGIVRIPRDRDKPWIELPVVGASGSGTLATFKLTVNEAGDSDIEFTDVQVLDSNIDPIACDIINGYYYGPTADLVEGGKTWAHVVPPGNRRVVPGEQQSFHSKVVNNGDVPLKVRTTFDMWREDGEFMALGAGQWSYGFAPIPVWYEYLYVNEYSEWLEWDWTNPGSSLFGEPDGDYAESIVSDGITSLYGFEDITLLPNAIISNVKLEGYTQYPNGATDAVDIDCYSSGFTWYGSLFGTPDWGWHYPRWVGADLSDEYPAALTEEGLNDVDLLLYNFLGSADDPMRVDSVRLLVEMTYPRFIPLKGDEPVYVLEPGEELILDPAIWDITEYDTGKYYCTLTCWYSYNGDLWTAGDTVKTFTWKVTRSILGE